MTGLAALGRHAQFILVKYAPSRSRPGKTDKLPVDWRTGAVCDAHDPTVWLSQHAAQSLLPGFPGHSVGFVLTEGCGLWCVDADECVTPEGQWSTTAQRLFALLPGVAVEVSHSRRGLHFWGSGPVPPHRKKCTPLGLELYTEARFIALTGEVLQGSADARCDAGIAALVAACFAPDAPSVPAHDEEGPVPEWRGPTDDEELIRRALASRSAAAAFGQGASFADLWECRTEVLARAYPSSSGDVFDRSSADAALCAHLAFWTGRDRARVARLLQRSGLARDKHQREDYLAATVGGACARAREVYQAPVVHTTADAAWASLQMLPSEQLRTQWAEVARAMPAAEAQRLVDRVAYRLGESKATLRTEIREAHAEQVAAVSAAEVATRAGERLLLQYSPDIPHVLAEQVERAIVANAGPGAYVSFGRTLSRVVGHRIEPINEAELLKLVAQHAAFWKPRKGGAQELIEPPAAVLKILLNQRTGSAAPAITGVVTTPVVLEDGHVVQAPGVCPRTGLFVTPGAAEVPVRPYSLEEARAAVAWLREHVLAGFTFESDLDRDAALAGLFTFVQRRALDIAPGFAALAHHQASGKTTLCRVLHLIVTGRDLSVSAFPTEGEEGDKAVAAQLMRNTPAICYDNVAGAWTLRSRVLAQVLTSPEFEARVLGSSTIVSCPTNTWLCLTGNNLNFASDEASRWISCVLTTRAARGPDDVASHALGLRQQALQHVLGIISGCTAVGGLRLIGSSRFPQWDRAVRAPLVWAGAVDPMACFVRNDAAGSDQASERHLIALLRQAFEGSPFSVSNLRDTIALGRIPELKEALEMLGVQRMDSARELHRPLRRLLQRPVEGAQLVQVPSAADRRVSQYAVIEA